MDGELRTMNPIEGSGGDKVNGDIWHEIHSRFKLKEAKTQVKAAYDMTIFVQHKKD